MRATICWIALAALLALPHQAGAQSAENVLVVINENSAASVAIGGHYAKARSIGREQVVLLRTETAEVIDAREYTRSIETPIAQWITRRGLQDRILYIVLTKGVPIRIRGTAGINGSDASVDSELTLLYRKLLGMAPTTPGREKNPYFLDDKPVTVARRFTRFDQDVYLVTRLDGYTVEDVIQMIDRGLSPVREGRIVLDQRRHLLDTAGGDRWLADAAARLESIAPGRPLLDETKDVVETDAPALGYYSWGSNDNANRRRGAGVKFVPGALAGMFVSTDGRTFEEPPADWVPGLSNKPAGVFGSGSQSMAADLIREGATGISAHVSEPYLDGTVRPHLLFPAYLAGFNLAEAFYLSMPYLSWRNIIVGDPLVAPFRDRALTPGEIAKHIDPETELPALFAERRLSLLGKAGLHRQALQALLRGSVRYDQGDKAGAEKWLVQARQLEPRLLQASLQLGMLYEEKNDFDRAIVEYRRVVAGEPRNSAALNNLAYALAVHKNQPKEALPFAEQAYSVSRQPFIADTLGWIHHLLGNHTTALPLVEQAAAAAPDSAEIQKHAAFVQAAAGQPEKARTALETALKLDPSLAERDDVKELKRRIQGG
jgi:uncharacterized protein (TIGR03790 family)